MDGSPAAIVLDTSVASIIFNRRGSALFYEQHLKGVRSVISFQTVEEMFYGAYLAGWGLHRWEELKEHVDQYEIIWPSEEIAHVCARLRSERRSVGRELRNADAWIAATALTLSCPLASHDGDFEGIPGLQLIRATSR